MTPENLLAWFIILLNNKQAIRKPVIRRSMHMQQRQNAHFSYVCVRYFYFAQQLLYVYYFSMLSCLDFKAMILNFIAFSLPPPLVLFAHSFLYFTTLTLKIWNYTLKAEKLKIFLVRIMENEEQSDKENYYYYYHRAADDVLRKKKWLLSN